MQKQVGTYHSASMRINLKAPTPGIVSRGIGLEGFCSILAGLWGSGTGSTTLTENVHTIDITKMASRRVVEVGAALMILFSFIGIIISAYFLQNLMLTLRCSLCVCKTRSWVHSISFLCLNRENALKLLSYHKHFCRVPLNSLI